MKSVKFIADLFRSLAVDLKLEDKDTFTLVSRIEAEGLPFACEILPKLARATLAGLESRHFECPTEFGKYKQTMLPCFMRQHFSVLFTEFGSVRPVSKAQASALYVIRQVCDFVYKADYPYSAEKEQSVIENFIATESEIRKDYLSVGDNILDLAREYITKVFKNFDFKPEGFYGPGVCSNASVSEKHTAKLMDSQVLSEYRDSYFWDARHLVEADQIRMNHASLFNAALNSKVKLVNKDSRGPRLICCEPTTNQWIQMPLMRQIVDAVEKHPIVRSSVHFTEQWINGALALENSESRQWATLDLKDASDRIRLDLVETLFRDTSLLKPLLLSRSPYIELPDGSFIKPRKFAPMGSAVCFPVMALCIWAIAHAAISYEKGQIVYDSVYVYGDDLVCGTSNLFVVKNALEKVGLRFNPNKCFDESYFRESCGVDAYFGVDVTPIRLKKPPKADLPVKENVCRLIDFSNGLSTLPEVQTYVRKVASKMLGKPIAFTSSGLPGCFKIDEFDPRISANKGGRYVVQRKPLQKVRSASSMSLLPISFNRIGREVKNDVSDVDLREQKFSCRKIRVTEWRSQF